MKQQQEGFLIPESFNNIFDELDKSTILICLHLYRFFYDIDVKKASTCKKVTISDLIKEVKVLSRNTVIRALEQIKEKELFDILFDTSPKSVTIYMNKELTNIYKSIK